MKYQLLGKDNTKYHRLLKKDAVPSLLLSPVASTSSRPSRECEEDTEEEGLLLDVSSLSSMCGRVSDASTEAFPDRESEVDRQQQDLLHDVSSLSSTSGRVSDASSSASSGRLSKEEDGQQQDFLHDASSLSSTASVGTSFCESELAKELYITANSFKYMDLGLDPLSELYDEEEGTFTQENSPSETMEQESLRYIVATYAPWPLLELFSVPMNDSPAYLPPHWVATPRDPRYIRGPHLTIYKAPER
ncbi:hypothetical protein Pcinc_008034 [Petrolisthes cinctipes]|uniref:Uncharacterized protein n=1 Tax=Petrolisthes cinctipes TaxID=88211 RepID=A0AAE1G9U2_PETCI|nr:hypothetical protein Pcinc_008034 [Petrolisthes cinctipes]